MAGQVVIPFPAGRAGQGRGFGGQEPAIARYRGEPRAWVTGRLRTAIGVVRAVFETLSYLSEPRVHPPLPALPPLGRTQRG
jgi:hypothetical protein